ncbi:MAG: hypothetical protein JWM68_2927 [Verrucomicrobiales bacterium]|nr:hypothetical protein [Verrucomicrobiales bacterium]
MNAPLNPEANRPGNFSQFTFPPSTPPAAGVYGERHLHSLIENVSDIVAVLNDEGFVRYVSPSVERILGYRPQDIVGTNAFDLIHLDDLLAAKTSFVQALLNPGQSSGLVPVRTRYQDGSWGHMEAIGKSLPDALGQLIVVLSLRDITSRKEAEAALQRSEYKLRLHSEQTRMALIEWDTEFRITGWNAAAEKMFGYTADEVVGKTGGMIVPESSKGLVREIGRDLLLGQGGERMTNENLTRDGRKIICDWCNTPLLTAEGKVIGIISLVEDVTERQVMAEQMREQASLLDLAQDAILVWDLEQRIKYWNKSAERLYGWMTDEVIGQQVSTFLFPKKTSFQAALITLMEKGEWSGELVQTAKSGKEIFVSSRWTLVKNSQGRAKSVLVINTDITEKKQLQAHFLRAQRIESLGTLASGIAHDLNNIFAPILMITPMLRSELKRSEALARLDTLESSALHGVEIVKQILTFSRGLKTGKEPIQMHQLMEGFARLIREVFPKSITLHFTIPKDLWVVNGNATELHQVLMNLFINARDAMPSGGVLTLIATNIILNEETAPRIVNARPGRYVSWQVSDTGVGIPPENMARIFDPFFSTKEQAKGTGLGLSIMHGIINNHDGCIEVQSREMQGTEFKIYLPASNA